MIIAADQKQLLVVLVDILPDFFGFCKIKNSAGYISDLACRNRTFDDRRKRAAMQLQHSVQNPARIIAVQIPVSVIRQIDNGRFVRSCVIVNIQRVIFRHRICHRKIPVSRHTVHTVRHMRCKRDKVFSRQCLPHHLVQAMILVRMQIVYTIVRQQMIFPAVNRK